MLLYLQIVLFLSLIILVGAHFYCFIFPKKNSKTFLLLIDFWVLLIYTLYLSTYYVTNNLTFFKSPKETFFFLGWMMTLVFFITEFFSNQSSIGFLLTPLIAFISLLGLAVSSVPEILNFKNDATQKIVLVQIRWLMLLTGNVFYFYSIILTVINYRLYIELKYHLPLFFNPRLPSIPQMDRSINRYLLMGNLFILVAMLLFVYDFFSLKSDSNINGITWWWEYFYIFLVWSYFSVVWCLRRKKILTVKINLLVLASGSFLLLYLIYL